MGKGKIVKTYDYTDENGKMLYQSCRLEPKGFFQRRPVVEGAADSLGARDGWIYSLKGVPLVLYRLPEIIASEGLENRMVIVVEGEKDADRLAELGFIATCNPMGAGSWRHEFSQQLAGRRVAVLPDYDKVNEKTGKRPGSVHVAEVCRSLHAAGVKVRAVDYCPGALEMDISDWLEVEGNTASRLKEIIMATPLYGEPKKPAAEKPVVVKESQVEIGLDARTKAAEPFVEAIADQVARMYVARKMEAASTVESAIKLGLQATMVRRGIVDGNQER